MHVIAKGRALQPFGWEFSEGAFDLLIDEPSIVHARLADNGVVVFRGESFSDAQMVRLLEGLGEITFTEGEQAVTGYPQLNCVSNVGKSAPRSVFHSDTSYVQRPPAYTALRPVELPSRGGATLFTNQYYAWQRLPNGIKQQLIDLQVLHVVSGLDTTELSETEAWHYLARRHPQSGRLALFLTTPKRCSALRDGSGKLLSNASRIIDLLYRHSIRRCGVYRHDWQPGDLVLWDNRCTMHRGHHEDVIGNRVFHRGMVLPAVPSPATQQRAAAANRQG